MMEQTSPQSKLGAWWPYRDKGRRLLSWRWTRSWWPFSDFQFSNFQIFKFLFSKVADWLVGDEYIPGDIFQIFNSRVFKFSNFNFQRLHTGTLAMKMFLVTQNVTYCIVLQHWYWWVKMSKYYWYWWVESNCISCPTDKRKTNLIYSMSRTPKSLLKLENYGWRSHGGRKLDKR